MTKRKYSLLGGEASITIRYGWAIIQNFDHDTAAITVPTVNRWRMQFDLVSWHETYDDAMATISAMHIAGITPEDWKEQHRGRRSKAEGTPAEQGGGGPSAEPRQITSGPATVITGLGERLVAAIARTGGISRDIVAEQFARGAGADGGA